MDYISYEIVAHIAKFLNAGDAVSFGATSRRNREISLARLDPERYLMRTFKNVRYLLVSMTEHACVLSGSRALEYFVPGAIEGPGNDKSGADTLSDWDFLVPCVKSSVYGMMDALSRCGVEWQHPLTEILELLEKPYGTTAYLAIARFNYYDPSIHTSALPEGTPYIIFDLFAELRRFAETDGRPADQDWVAVSLIDIDQGFQMSLLTFSDMVDQKRNPLTGLPLGPGETFDVSNHEHGTSYSSMSGKPINFFNGYITPPGGLRQKVQLFQCHNCDKDDVKNKSSTPLEYIIDTYYATHVQCFISGWSAGHFYYDLASQKLSLAWETSSRERLQKCVAKYRSRGFRFFLANNSPDDYSCIEYDDDLNWHRHDDSNNNFVVANDLARSPISPAELLEVGPLAGRVMQVSLCQSVSLQDNPGSERRLTEQQKPPQGTPMPLTSRRNGPLSLESYDTLLSSKRRTSDRRLGGPGTLAIRFIGFQEAVKATVDSNRLSSGVATSSDFAKVYTRLDLALSMLRVVTTNRPHAAEPSVPSMPHFEYGEQSGTLVTSFPHLRAALSQPFTELEPKQSPNTSRLHRHYELINLLSASSCYPHVCFKGISKMMPPQI
ncbi:hypothetical protein SEPCBS57363_005395 [Sporothrix epigloea]|uniref:F-box domain-containing protein n=1 Tax=Sporothrix epigloea TaxID=1892477 RepID=A0ABP0DXG8_9PEZI